MLSAVSDYPIPLDAGIFGLMDRQALDSINGLREGNRYLPGLRAWVGYKNAIVYYDRQDRLAGDGKLSFISRIKYAMDAICSFSYKPLRLCFALAALSIATAVVLALCTAFAATPVTAVGLWVAAAVFTVGCMFLLCMGIVGEYLGRVYDEVRNRPLSIINKVYYAQEEVGAGSPAEFADQAALAFKVRAA